MWDPAMLRAWAKSIAERHEKNPNVEWQIETGIAGPTMQGPGGSSVTAHKVYAPAILTRVDQDACVLHFTALAEFQRKEDKRTVRATLIVDLPLWLVQSLTDMTEATQKLSSPIIAPPRM